MHMFLELEKLLKVFLIKILTTWSYHLALVGNLEELRVKSLSLASRDKGRDDLGSDMAKMYNRGRFQHL